MQTANEKKFDPTAGKRDTLSPSKNEDVLCGVPPRPARLPFTEVLRNVRRQILLTAEYRGLYKNEELAEDIAKIMTEVYMLSDDAEVLISDEKLSGYLVKEVFREIRAENVENVIDYFCGITRRIAKKRQYLRSALYNSVFELEAEEVNGVNLVLNGNDGKENS